ncbi:MAG: hypothetical protein HZA07_00150 [Nitrospirae bacterium]|nr:hypothetical protein [Nitrospirota bacterium]
MRYWKTIDGKYLVEAATVNLVGVFYGYKFRSPSGEEVDYGYRYYLQDNAGQIVEIYEGHVGADQEVFYVTTHIVIGNALYSWHCYKTDDDPPDPARDEIVMEGLEPIDPSELPFNITLQEALKTYKEAQLKQIAEINEINENRKKKELLRSPDQLPDLEGMTDLDAVVDCQHPLGNIVVSISGIEVWKESILLSGEERPEQIESILRAKYKSRLRSFTSKVDYDDLLGR